MSDEFKLYEKLIDRNLDNELKKLEEHKNIHKEKLESSTSATQISSYLQEVIERGLGFYKQDSKSVAKQLNAANSIIEKFDEILSDRGIIDATISDDYMLRGITGKHIDKKFFSEHIPQSSVAQSNLFTGTKYEAPISSELRREITSSDRIDFLVSFIKFSGIVLIYNDLVEYTRNRKLRIITTSYMGATDFKAVMMLAKLPNTEVKISYDTKRTRLHAKAYYFHRETGFSTAYIGSSNISKAALSEGTEWNLKVSEYSSKEIIQKIRITFDTYWNMDEFQTFNPDSQADIDQLKKSLSEEKIQYNPNNYEYFFDLRPYVYQQEILDRLDVEREVFHSYKNLIVAATGTGKTVVCAFDFKRIYEKDSNIKLLFIAHRKEILKQSLSAFKGILHDENFGELWVDDYSPSNNRHLFASIQTLNSGENYKKFDEDYFDYIVFDESHHSAADSYTKILDYFKPKILLGLTATPERMDGVDILEFFNNRIAYEIRLKEAIERNLLCPFQYFGISDSVDLSSVKWQKGSYDVAELNAKYIDNKRRDNEIINAIDNYVLSREYIKGLGFCVSKEQAKYMEKVFNERDIPSIHLDSDSPKEIRDQAKNRLVKGEIKFIFVVDLYNEGVDIPEVNTVLFLRPTESSTIFIQQLGRGLRLQKNKEVLTVLDFIGQAHKNYSYQSKLQNLIGGTSYSIQDEIKMEFPSIPKNCSIQLEKIAKEYVLKNIQTAYINNKMLVSMFHDFRNNFNSEISLKNFIEFYKIEPQSIYKFTTFFELCNPNSMLTSGNPLSKINELKNPLMKIAKINSLEWLKFLISYFKNPNIEIDNKEYKMLLMFYYTIFTDAPTEQIQEVFSKIRLLNSEIINEIVDIMEYNVLNMNHLPKSVVCSEDINFELHASYSTDQVLTLLGYHNEKGKKGFREGVKYIKELNMDVFFVTLNKSANHFKESTRYADYAINENLFHWQSQSGTTVANPTGKRYIDMSKNGSRVLLFVRQEQIDIFGATETYICLGYAKYLSHEGSKPITIVYRLEEQMTAKILKYTNQIVDIN